MKMIYFILSGLLVSSVVLMCLLAFAHFLKGGYTEYASTLAIVLVSYVMVDVWVLRDKGGNKDE